VDYEFDLAKDGVNRTKHGVSLALAEVLFAGPHLALDDGRSTTEKTANRLRAYSGPTVRLRLRRSGLDAADISLRKAQFARGEALWRKV
jgi:uncharacterized DUF497 family protein